MQTTEFEGHVVAWSFGHRAEVLGGPDFELEVPDMGRSIPSLVGLSSSAYEVVNREKCLLHPVVTCLARDGETFEPPLCLRFPVGDVDSMESGSDSGSHDDDEVAYRAHLESTFAAVTRKNGGSQWIPIHGSIVRAEDVFVLEVTVSHFCEFALKQVVAVDPGCVELVSLPTLSRKSRRSHYHFLNLGQEDLLVHCWGAARKEGFWKSFSLKLGVGLTSGHAAVDGNRQAVDVPATVSTVDVPGMPVWGVRSKCSIPCVVLDGLESLTVAWTTQRRICPPEDRSHVLVQVLRSRPMPHKHVMVFGPWLDGAEPLVSNLRVDDGVNVGKAVKSEVE